MANRLAIGVDVGGTKVAAGLVDSAGRVVYGTRHPMAADGSAADGLAAVRQAIEEVFAGQPQARKTIAGIGIGSPGPLDPFRGMVINPRNIPAWRNFPLAEEITRAYGVPVRLDNDANAAALGEALWGAGAAYRHVFHATLGTGIGTGIVIDKRIYHGRTGNAGEGGHVSIDYRGPQCNCGKRGCIEVFCAGPAIARRAREALVGPGAGASKIGELVSGRLDDIRAETVAEAFAQGDALAARLFEETADLLAVWLGNVVDLLEPDVMILGGGVFQSLAPLLGRIREQVPRWSFNPRAAEIPLVPAQYGADSGIIGAAALILSPAGSNP